VNFLPGKIKRWDCRISGGRKSGAGAESELSSVQDSGLIGYGGTGFSMIRWAVVTVRLTVDKPLGHGASAPQSL